MDTKTLLELRKQAEQAVSDMSDGDLKLKAFEVILGHLLAPNDTSEPAPAKAGKEPAKKANVREAGRQADSLIGRVLVLRDEGFFKAQRALGEIRDELQAHGWHYPLTTLSGSMQNLVRKRELRRQRLATGKKKVWKYSNP